jgi:hypothetical protein
MKSKPLKVCVHTVIHRRHTGNTVEDMTLFLTKGVDISHTIRIEDISMHCTLTNNLYQSLTVLSYYMKEHIFLIVRGKNAARRSGNKETQAVNLILRAPPCSAENLAGLAWPCSTT